MLEKYAQENGFKNTRVFIDDGWPGTTFARPAFTQKSWNWQKKVLSVPWLSKTILVWGEIGLSWDSFWKKDSETDKIVNLQQFIRKVKKITELKALTPELIHEFVEKIVVYAPKYLDGRRIQIVDIHYSGIGILDELTPEEMEESFQKSIAERKKTETA